MQRLNRKQTLLLIAAGLFVIAAGQIIPRFLSNPESFDFLMGLIEGAGIGLLITALIKGKTSKTA